MRSGSSLDLSNRPMNAASRVEGQLVILFAYFGSVSSLQCGDGVRRMMCDGVRMMMVMMV